MAKKNILQRLGPGLLFAGAAVGVSHLVYSTKAGANFGFGLLWLVIIANIVKYPFFEFGPRYAMAKGESLLKGYQRLGNWVLLLFVLITLGTMFTILAAVSLVTASLASHLFGLSDSLMTWVIILLGICTTLLVVGRYSLLDHLMKIIIIALTSITLITVIAAFVQKETAIVWTAQFVFDSKELLFIIAFMGWMPAPLDLSVWHSLWALEKKKENQGDFDMKESLFDFNVGYIGTTLLAFFFMALGALIMYGSGQEFSPKGTVFSAQLIELYTATLGTEIGFVVGLAAFITMFSTTITCLDALPRSMAKAHSLLVAKEDEKENEAEYQKYYYAWLVVLLIGALVILNLLLTNMATFLMVATILSFLTAPFFAIANYRLVTKHLSKEQQPPTFMKVLSWIGIVYLFGFCAIYISSF